MLNGLCEGACSNGMGVNYQWGRRLGRAFVFVMSGFGVDLEVVDGILGLMNVFTYCAVEENKWRKLVVGSLAAALVAFLLKPASPSSFCFALNWIGSGGIESLSSAISRKECMYYY